MGRFSGSPESFIDQDLAALEGEDEVLDKLVEQLRLWHGGLRVESRHFTGWSLGARFAVAQRLVDAFGELVLLAPVSGVLYPLERVPDPVFSQKLAGDGISIDPTDNILRAPCPGEIVQQHAAGHAVTLKAAGDVEVLMHVGIDTVTLKGKGFTSRVKIGDKVETGAPLIEFDLDYVATNAKSLLTEVIISNGERVSKTVYGSGTATVGKTPVLTLTFNGAGRRPRRKQGRR